VITHGTDTIEETAYLLDLLHHDPRPVVVVGAMRTSDDLSWDGPVNLFSGCLVAGDRNAVNRGVMVVMNNTINAASEVTKTYTESIDTFVSPDTGPLGIVDLRRVLFYRQPVSRARLPWVKEAKRVELIEATSGSDGVLIDAAVSAGCAGLIIAAMGRGNVPPAMAEAMGRAIKAGVAVVVVSRCWGGRVAPIYGYEGGGARLRDMGAVFAPWLNGPKARIALSLALASGYDQRRLETLFDWPMA
jgi:L-asparaginase